jgi:hypothetical protein
MAYEFHEGIPMSQFALDTYSEDIEAINHFFQGQTPKNQAASDRESDWTIFYSKYQGSSWYDRSFSKVLWDEARAIRDAYNVANGTPSAPGALTAKDLGQDTPLGGGLGSLPSNIADQGLGAGLWASIPTGVKVAGGAVLGLFALKTINDFRK